MKLDGPAKKVVGTEWNAVESLISLGVDPTGVADVKGYKTWDTAVPLKNDPSRAATEHLKQMRKIAPVLNLRPADAADPIGQMTENLDLLAEATGTTERATKLKKDFEAKLAEGRKKLAAAGHGGAKYAFADGYVTGNQTSIRPYTSGSLIGAVNEKLGLKNDWTAKGDKAYGLGATDVEGLTKLDKDVHFAYIGNDGDKSSNPFTGVLKKDKVWTSLPFVKKGNVHRLPDGIWMFGGTESMSQYIDSVVEALKK